MPTDATREAVAARLRKRILRGLRSGALAPGDRLPSARESAAEFDADHRVVLAAYRQLATEGLVERRVRAGIYVARTGAALLATPGVDWLVDTLIEGLTREVPIVELHDWMRRAIATRLIRAVVIARTHDEVAGISRELREDYGLHVAGAKVSELERPSPALSAEIDGADLLVTTRAYARLVRALGRRVHVRVVVAQVGPDLLGGDWRALLRKPLYILVSDESTVASTERSFAGVEGAAKNLHVMVVGRDDVAAIPREAAVYISGGAADVLGSAPVGGSPLPRARWFSWTSAREIVSHIVRANLEALSEEGRPAVAEKGVAPNAR